MNLCEKLCVGSLVVLTLFHLTNGCRISSGWRNLEMDERLMLSDIIVYGKTAQHVANVRQINGRRVFSIDAVFHVYCVLKKTEFDVAEVITIERIAPRDGCSGTKQYMQIGTEAIVAIKRAFGGQYQYHEVMPTQSATFEASREHFFKISSFCGLQSWQPPRDATADRCPVCGVANFTTDVMGNNNNNNDGFNACLLGGLANQTDCSQFLLTTFDNSSSCVPSDFRNTCTKLTTAFVPTATCECGEAHSGRGADDLNGVNGAATLYPRSLSTWLAVTALVYSASLGLTGWN